MEEGGLVYRPREIYRPAGYAEPGGRLMTTCPLGCHLGIIAAMYDRPKSASPLRFGTFCVGLLYLYVGLPRSLQMANRNNPAR